LKICFLTKREKPGVEDAIAFTKNVAPAIEVYYGSINDPFPKKVLTRKYDILISYISPWIIPANTLSKTKNWNINFHPGPPEYPGIGCFNFAIYESSQKFGVTAHVMEAKVDTGKIIGVKRFKMDNNETVKTLSQKTYNAQLKLYKDVMHFIFNYKTLPDSTETWQRKPYKRIQLEELATISPNMSKDEIRKRIRATYYKGKPAPYIELYGSRFEYNPER
tara:strand:- start:366 stop:1025 length:660 start_codon:yes stop_codon:yes gene_type:complete